MAENRTRWSVAPMPRPGPLSPSPFPPTRGQGERGQRSCPSGSSSPPIRGRGRERGPRGGLANCPVFSRAREGAILGGAEPAACSDRPIPSERSRPDGRKYSRVEGETVRSLPAVGKGAEG